MVRVITYGTYDVLHFGHIRLLERAKAMGDYLIVGVTSDDFDRIRGKINVQQSLSERIEAVKATGIADEVIVEEYEGQKIDDIKKYDISIFTVGSDWKGKFDYLNQYCQVVYLDRTHGVSSSKIRSVNASLKLGLVGSSAFINKVGRECAFVNGIHVVGICSRNFRELSGQILGLPIQTHDYRKLLSHVDAVYIHSYPKAHYQQVKLALEHGVHVICESPLSVCKKECDELLELAEKRGLILMEAIRTAYATAFSRLLLLLKGGCIGSIFSVDATCTSLINCSGYDDLCKAWNSISDWGPTALLPVFELLGVDYRKKEIVTHLVNREAKYDTFSKVSFVYANAVASIKVGNGVKSEGELIVSGTEGYAYVPAPWWKTDYFELRYENASENKRYFYQLDGEGIRHELVAFVRAVQDGRVMSNVEQKVTKAIAALLEDFYQGVDVILI